CVAGAPAAALELDAQVATVTDDVLEGAVSVRNTRPLRVDEGGLPLEAFAAHVRASTAAVTLAAIDVTLPGDARLTGEAGITLPAEARPLSATATLAVTGLDPARLHAEAPRGRIALELGAAYDAPDRMRLDFRLGEGTLLDLALGGAGRLEVAGLRVPDADLRLTLGPSRLSVRGAWGEAGDALDVQLVARRLERLGLGLAGNVDLEGRLAGTPEAPAGRFRLSGEALRLPGDVAVARIRANGGADDGLDGVLALELD